MNSEIWRDIPWCPYQASSIGRIRRSATKKVLKPGMNTKGYRIVSICFPGYHKTATVHRLVLEAFIGLRPHDRVANHRDGNKLNNWINNLEYVTHAENEKHASLTGLKAAGDNHGSHTMPHRVARGDRVGTSKLNPASVKAIRERRRNGETARLLAEEFGVHPRTVREIVRYKLWTQV